MNIVKIFKEKYFSNKVLLGEWILAIVTGLLIFATTSYTDSQSLTIWSTNVWDVIVDSNIRHLYEYTAENIYNVPHTYLGSELMSILPWSIWNLPIWLIQRFAGISIINSPWMLAYSKLFLVVSTVVMLRYTYKICFLLTQNKSKSMWCVFLTASSMYLYITVCYSGQNDILMITASVMAVYYLLSGKSKQFYLLSSLAIAIKPFYLLPYIAVIFLYEKDIFKIALKVLVGISGIVIQKICFIGAPMYAESMSMGPSISIIKEMFPGNLKTAFGSVSFFAIALVLIYFYAYTRKFDKKTFANIRIEEGKHVIHLITVTYLSYLMFSPFSYYRIALLIPFLYLVIIQNKDYYLYNVLLECAMSLALMFNFVLRGANLFRLKHMNRSIFQDLMGYKVDYKNAFYPSLADWFGINFEIIYDFQAFFSGIALITAILLLLLNHPSNKIKLQTKAEDCPRVIFWLRTVMLIPFLLRTILLFVSTSCKIY